MTVYNLWNLEITKMEKEKIFGDIKEKFYDMFCQLKKEIDENWI